MKKIFKIIGLCALAICLVSGLYSVFIDTPDKSSQTVAAFDTKKYKKIDSKNFEPNYYKLGTIDGFDHLLRSYTVYQKGNKSEEYYVKTSFALRDKEGNLRGPVGRHYIFNRKNNEIYHVFPKTESWRDVEIRKITKAELENPKSYSNLMVLKLYKLIFHEEFVLR